MTAATRAAEWWKPKQTLLAMNGFGGVLRRDHKTARTSVAKKNQGSDKRPQCDELLQRRLTSRS
jgi:hypothetical protein